MIQITSLGGSGEDSRNCFWVKSNEFSILLDCGVRREIAAVPRVYPLLTAEIARGLDAVILSHAHEDHTAALPYLYELGYRGAVYAAAETIEQTPPFLRKWAEYVKQHGGTLPFDEENIGRLIFKPIEELPFPIRYGMDGHILGGLWYRFETEGRSILYTGDLTYESLLLAADPLPTADILIIDSAYAGKKIIQRDQYDRLTDTARQVTASGGRLLLPVPVNGRGIDLFIWLSRCVLPLYAENNIIRNAVKLSQRTAWIKPFTVPEKGFTAVNDENRTAVLNAGMPGVFLFGDGMMTSAVSAAYFDAVRDDPLSRVIISGHSAAGTLANDLQQAEWRRRNAVRASAERLTIKVHNDETDVLHLAEAVSPQAVMLFHSDRSSCMGLAGKLSAKGLTVVCGTAPAGTGILRF